MRRKVQPECDSVRVMRQQGGDVDVVVLRPPSPLDETWERGAPHRWVVSSAARARFAEECLQPILRSCAPGSTYCCYNPRKHQTLHDTRLSITSGTTCMITLKNNETAASFRVLQLSARHAPVVGDHRLSALGYRARREPIPARRHIKLLQNSARGCLFKA